MNSNAPNAMIARLKLPSGLPNAVIAKGSNRGKTPNAIVAKERWPGFLIYPILGVLSLTVRSEMITISRQIKKCNCKCNFRKNNTSWNSEMGFPRNCYISRELVWLEIKNCNCNCNHQKIKSQKQK